MRLSFFQAQCETFARAKNKVGSSRRDLESVRATVTAAVRVAMREAGGDPDRPTPESLAATVRILARKANAWGTPDDVIAHHQVQIGRMLSALGVAL